MPSGVQLDTLAEPYGALLRSLHPGIVNVRLLRAAESIPALAPDQLAITLTSKGGQPVATVVLQLAAGTNKDECAARIQPTLDCLASSLVFAASAQREFDLRLLRLTNDLDLDFSDDIRLDEAVARVAGKLGVDLAWFAAPRCQLSLAVRGNDRELEPALRNELTRMRERVAPLTGKLRRPLVIQGKSQGAHSAECQLLLMPLFVGRERHHAWLVLANPLSAAPFGGWHLLAALTLGQGLARRLERELDPRTGLINRNGLESALSRMKSSRAGMILLDIDRLHSVNQLHGMAAGDAAILALARLLSPPLLPANALVASIMGGQFAIVLPEMNAMQSADLAAQLQTAAAGIRPGLPDDDSPMTLSAGVLEIEDTLKPFDSYAINIDSALKLAKDRGRSRVEVFTSSSSTLIRRSDEVMAAADLREALRTGELLLFAQPIRLLADRRAPPGFELLIRMRNEAGEIVSPGEFIAAAQRFQLLESLDQYVVDAAFKALAPHRSLLTRLSSSFSINVSGQSLGSEAFIDFFLDRLRTSRIPGGLITVEVTEQAALTCMQRAGASIKRLREVRCGIAIDDFGTGANSLAYLRSLPVTRLKIDGSFVRDLLTNQRSVGSIRGILQLAHEFRLDTVAEYIESEAVARRLASMGVQRGQGYLFGKPEPLELALHKLQEEEHMALQELFLEA